MRTDPAKRQVCRFGPHHYPQKSTEFGTLYFRGSIAIEENWAPLHLITDPDQLARAVLSWLPSPLLAAGLLPPSAVKSQMIFVLSLRRTAPSPAARRGDGVRVHYATPPPGGPGGVPGPLPAWPRRPTSRRGEFRAAQQGQLRQAQFENTLGRRQLRRRKRHEVAEEAPARGRLRSPRWVAGGAAGGTWKEVSMAIRMRTTRDKGGACGQRCHAWQPMVGCDADAAPSESWRRGQSPHVTTPPAVPEGWRNPGQFVGRAEGGPCPGQNKIGGPARIPHSRP